MSLQEISAERRFWGTAELIENLLPFLDTSSTQQLAESHKLTRRILRNSLSWNKLIERTFPHEQYTTMNHYSLPEPIDAILESERSQAVSLAKILMLIVMLILFPRYREPDFLSRRGKDRGGIGYFSSWMV